MNGGSEWWRMIRCAGGAQDKSVANRIMLRFKPIAPKPASAGSDVVSDRNQSRPVLSKGIVRKKRKYVKARRNSGYTGKKKPAASAILSGENIEEDDRTATLQLLPEKSDLDRSINALDLSSNNISSSTSNSSSNGTSACGNFQENRGLPMWLNSKIPDQSYGRVLVVHAWVTVECVTGTCMADDREGAVGYGSKDVERVRILERDTCPGFVSDGSNSVIWVNRAFRRMVVRQAENDGLLPEITVGLVIKEKLPSVYSSLTGHVKLQYTLLGGVVEKYYSRMVPCDLWRMDGGGFAWRLDVEAALTLGR
ncbi:hypothetical protein PanWU01x14_269280 [Parasponia andersonii]|uniref:DUF7950 domain-containing protein n=1 Tax=Parasponia andersonii TaxID=3476 RepID=A0A2P5B5C7_PARAD|nr:hypothetical protein PanWU01x14_269280 [Parasponia andersonii]